MDWPWTPAMVKQIRDAGLGVFVWTVNKPEDIARFKALGVDGITTDDPCWCARPGEVEVELHAASALLADLCPRVSALKTMVSTQQTTIVANTPLQPQ